MNTWFYVQLVKKILDGSYWVCLTENRHLNFRVFRKSDYNGKSSVDNLTPDKVVWKPIKWEKWTLETQACMSLSTFEILGLEILGSPILLKVGPGFYYVKKPKRFWILSSDKSSELNLPYFFDIIKPRRIENLQNQ